jgi:hypothetical protein
MSNRSELDVVAIVVVSSLVMIPMYSSQLVHVVVAILMYR